MAKHLIFTFNLYIQYNVLCIPIKSSLHSNEGNKYESRRLENSSITFDSLPNSGDRKRNLMLVLLYFFSGYPALNDLDVLEYSFLLYLKNIYREVHK